MAHTHTIVDSDIHFIIDTATRNITTNSKKKLVQYDHNSERVTFEIARIIEGHDMTACDRVEIHYINQSSTWSTDKHEDVYIVDDVQLKADFDDTVVFSWLISGNATRYAGTLGFLVRFVCLTEGSEVSYAWNTDICKALKVSDGMDNSATIVGENLDLLEGWKRELEASFADQISTAVSEEIDRRIDSGEIGGGGTADIKIDNTLKRVNGVLGVNTATEVEADNTLPITSAAVNTTVGNIAILLATI